jgi:hypothetical protein
VNYLLLLQLRGDEGIVLHVAERQAEWLLSLLTIWLQSKLPDTCMHAATCVCSGGPQKEERVGRSWGIEPGVLGLLSWRIIQHFLRVRCAKVVLLCATAQLCLKKEKKWFK